MAWCWDGELHVVMHDERDPTDAEWYRYVAELHEFSARPAGKILVYSSGGCPNGKQRHALTKTFRGQPVALVTSSPILRAMGLVMRTLNPAIRVLAPADEELGFEHLRLTADQRTRALSQRDQLARQLTAPSHGEPPRAATP